MCANYRPVTRMDRMLTFFGVERDRDEVPVDVFPTGLAPFIRRVDGTSDRQVATGAFGLMPHFATEVAYGRRTNNARSKTVKSLPSFKDAWRRSQRCVIPAEAIYEPNYESGRAVRWHISQHGDVPMGVAVVLLAAMDLLSGPRSRTSRAPVAATRRPIRTHDESLFHGAP